MKVAVCISGQTRSFGSCFDQIIEKLVDPNDADIFVHMWNSNNTQEIVDKLSKTGRTKGILVENQIMFNERDYRDRKSGPTVPFNVLSQFYGVWRAIDLKKQHEQASMAKYDAVIRTRTDLLPLAELKACNFDLSVLNVPDNNQKWSAHNQIEDHFALSNSEIMNWYGDYFLNIDSIWRQSGIQFHPEEMLTLWMLGEQISGVSGKRFEFGERKAHHKVIDFDYVLMR